MARLESIAIGGYYPTPTHLVGRIANLVGGTGLRVAVADPCAGDGAAALEVLQRWSEQKDGNLIQLFAVELEASRYKTLLSRVTESLRYDSRAGALHGDAFCVDWDRSSRGVDALWLNPPYDTEPDYARLEEKFLVRFTEALRPGGVLVFLVPYYALKASALTLAKHYQSLHCFRFPEPDWDGYKQVALIATRRNSSLWEPDAPTFDQVMTWAQSADTIPVLPDAGPPVAKILGSTEWSPALVGWTKKSIDLKSLLAKVEPWHVTDKSGKRTAISGILPDVNCSDMLTRRYPLAMPPRSAHIAAGIAAGVFNGARIAPDKPSSPLPEILVKGVFDKEYRTVEEKKTKEGEVKGVVQVQQPKLVTTVLDLGTSEYVTIKPSANITNATKIADMTMADLLAEYGHGLMEVMLRQCPVLHDPLRANEQIELPGFPRPLFEAQHQAVQAAVKLLGGVKCPKSRRRYSSAFVLGEIGSGKSQVALAVAHTIAVKRTLILCPPHLLTSWQDQIAAVVPWVRTRVLGNVEDVQAFATLEDDAPAIAIMSREVAKLGHAYESVRGSCPKCGTEIDSTVDHAKRRGRCHATSIIPKNELARFVQEFATALLWVFPDRPEVAQFCKGTAQRRMQKVLAARKKQDPQAFEASGWKRIVAQGYCERLLALAGESNIALVAAVLAAYPDPGLICRTARAMYSSAELSSRSNARMILTLLPESPDLEALIEDIKMSVQSDDQTRSYSDPWTAFWQKRANLYAGAYVSMSYGYSYELARVTRRGDNIHIDDHKVGDPAAIVGAIGMLATEELFYKSTPCGEPLYQAVPEPRRYPLATYIARKHPNLFDLLVLDECHEYSNDGTAQERSAHRLTSLGIPTLMLTGTIMNGYAESMFTNMWALSDDFRKEFARDERQRFVDRYGYRKRLLEERDKETGKIVAYGTHSDRVERSERVIGNAPGVLPLFLLKHLLPSAVTLHKTDLGIDIPKCSELVEMVRPTKEVETEYFKAQDALVAEIRSTMFDPDMAGKLWGAMAELPSYLDLYPSDAGNQDDHSYQIRYPESVGGALVHYPLSFDSSTLTPKEEWLLAKLDAELAEGRNVMVFAWHTVLLPRLARIIEKHTGMKCPILEPSKVPTAKRQDWIDAQIVSKKRRVMVVNPVAIQTGLNNLVYFATEIWMQNPACNPTVYRQAVGRVDRIGQAKPTRIFFPIYEGTAQQQLHSLLLHKVAVSMSTDGLDAEGALRAAGIVDDSGFSGFAVGRQLYEMIVSGSYGAKPANFRQAGSWVATA